MSQHAQPHVAPTAPDCVDVTEYDQQHFSTYARLVSAHDAGDDWRLSATEILGLDVEQDKDAAHKCWESHSIAAVRPYPLGRAARADSGTFYGMEDHQEPLRHHEAMINRSRSCLLRENGRSAGH